LHLYFHLSDSTRKENRTATVCQHRSNTCLFLIIYLKINPVWFRIQSVSPVWFRIQSGFHNSVVDKNSPTAVWSKFIGLLFSVSFYIPFHIKGNFLLHILLLLLCVKWYFQANGFGEYTLPC
jgi:hypothetical protein